jgi:predicted NAD/FAD-binding protein
MRIAVIGSGMAGLTAARLLRDAGHAVTVYEAAPRRGMDAHAVCVTDPKGVGTVDVPLRVMSSNGWRAVLALCRHHGVETFAVTTPVALSWLDQTTWFRSGNLRVAGLTLPTLGALRYVSRSTYTIVQQLWRLKREPRSATHGKTLEEFFTAGGYDATFWRGLILPLLLTISTCRHEHLLRYPAEDLLAMVQDMIFGAPLRRLQGGTRALVDRLAVDLELVSGAPVASVRRTKDGVRVISGDGRLDDYDYVVIATQANQHVFLDAEFEAEKTLLDRFVYDRGELYVHRDCRVMPRRRADWTSLSYLMDRRFESAMFSVWVNAVEPDLRQAAPVFQTWNPIVPLDAAKVLSRVPLERAVVSQATYAAQQDLAELTRQEGRRVFFCGSWAFPGVPLLESAARSAIVVARRLGAKGRVIDALPH